MREAPLLRRLVALCFDIIIVVCLLAGILYLLEQFRIYDAVRPLFLGSVKAYILVYVLYLCVFFIYELLFNSIFRSTPGKIMMSTETVSRTGFSFIRLFFRCLIKTITVGIAPVGIPITLIAAVLKGSTEVLHDIVGKTLVVSDSSTSKLIALLVFAASVALLVLFISEYHLLIIDIQAIDLPGFYKDAFSDFI